MHQSSNYIQVLSILFVRLQFIFACPCNNCMHKHTIHMDGKPTKGIKFLQKNWNNGDQNDFKIYDFPFFFRYYFDENFSDLYNGI